jgi:hypothetical protein
MKIRRREFLQKSVLAGAAISIDPSKIAALDASAGPSVNPDEQTLFAFDDHSIPWQHNLKVTLVEATKHPGNPVLRRGPEGTPDHGHAILYGTVIKDGRKFRMWYLGMFETEIKNGQAPGFWRPMCYAESEDGINWVKPELNLVEFNGNKRNNICLIEGSPFSLTRINDFLSVLYEPDDPDPLMRYKVAYIAHVHYEDIAGGMSNIGAKFIRAAVMICATSADGLSWKIVGDRPTNAGGEKFEVSSLYRFGGFYYATGQVISSHAWLPDGRNTSRIMMAYRSADFKSWSRAKAFSFARPGQLVNPPVKGQQSHMGAGIWNRGNVLVGLYGKWQDGLGPSERPKGASHLLGTHIDLGLIISNDGIHFREPVTDFAVLSHGAEGEWDSIALLQGHAFVNEGDHTMIWYSHWDTGMKLKSMEIGLATMRRDGFGYLSRKEDDNDAHFITAPFEAGKKQQLAINADGLTEVAPLTVELLDDLDKPLEGYSGADAAIISSDGTRIMISWAGKRYLPPSRKFAVKVYFPVNSNARIYALYITTGMS